MRNVQIFLIGAPEWKASLGKLRHRWENNIKVDLREILYVKMWTSPVCLTSRLGGLI
jgi:hypothetical protein